MLRERVLVDPTAVATFIQGLHTFLEDATKVCPAFVSWQRQSWVPERACKAISCPCSVTAQPEGLLASRQPSACSCNADVLKLHALVSVSCKPRQLPVQQESRHAQQTGPQPSLQAPTSAEAAF